MFIPSNVTELCYHYSLYSLSVIIQAFPVSPFCFCKPVWFLFLLWVSQPCLCVHPLDGADPEVLIYTLPEARDPNHDSVVCEVRGPSLGDVYVMWQVDGGGYVEGNTGLLHQDNGNVSVVSILTVKSQRVADATLFTCAVKHGGMKDYTAPLSVQYSKSKYPECPVCDY